MVNTIPARPLKVPSAVLLFGLPTLLFIILQRVAVPLLDAAGVSPLANFFILLSPHILFFFAAFITYRLEGNPWDRAHLAKRFRLQRMTAKNWAWAAAAAVGNIGLYLLLVYDC